MAASYPPPVDQLVTLGEIKFPDAWLDYRALGLSDEHVPALAGMLEDEDLQWEAWRKGDDSGRFWAPAHAWRALGQLGASASAAVEPLIRLLLRSLDSDWSSEEIPRVLGMIGPSALPAVREALGPAAANAEEPMGSARLGSALVYLARAHPETRGDAVAAVMDQLRAWPGQHETINAFLISDLIDLGAVEAAPLMEAAFAGEAVDESVAGDWEDVQVEMGLLSERITSPRPFLYEDIVRTRRPAKPAIPTPGSDSAAARSSKLRKAQKQASKRGHKRKR
jgi:hypothetical protein